MKVLITGAAGFIGEKVADTLSKSHNVSVVDLPNRFSEDQKDKYSIHEFDLSKKEWIDSLPRDFDLVVHCAAQTGGYYSLIDPQKDCKWNSLGTLNVVDFCRKQKDIKKVIYTSSMAVYGEGLNKTESDMTDPISFYGASKLSGENYLQVLSNQTKIPFTVFRLWNTYGSGQDMENMHQGMLSIYLSQALKSETVEITGSPDRVRDFVHVSDVVRAIVLSIEKSETDNQIYNLCSGIPYTSKEVIEKISKHLKKPLKIKQIQGYLGDQSKSSGQNKKLLELGWSPSYTLDAGIQEFIRNI
jgi:UDP-glucose 4-epimerase